MGFGHIGFGRLSFPCVLIACLHEIVSEHNENNTEFKTCCFVPITFHAHILSKLNENHTRNV